MYHDGHTQNQVIEHFHYPKKMISLFFLPHIVMQQLKSIFSLFSFKEKYEESKK